MDYGTTVYTNFDDFRMASDISSYTGEVFSNVGSFNVWCGPGFYHCLEKHLRLRRPGRQQRRLPPRKRPNADYAYSVTNTRTTVPFHELRLPKPTTTIHTECSVTEMHSILIRLTTSTHMLIE